MNIYIQLIIETSIVFILIFSLNYFYFVKKNKKLKKNNLPLELYCLSNVYNIDPKKINFKRFQYAYSLINSFIITATYLLVIYLIKSMILKVIFGIIILILLIIICYGLLGKHYQKQQQNNNKK